MTRLVYMNGDKKGWPIQPGTILLLDPVKHEKDWIYIGSSIAYNCAYIAKVTDEKPYLVMVIPEEIDLEWKPIQ